MVVLNKRKDYIPSDAIFIGRGSKWGNEYTHLPNTKAKFRVATRDEACNEHVKYLWNQIKIGEVTLEELAELHGKDLWCYCAPARCHGYTLEKAATWAFTKLLEMKNDKI